MKKILFEAHNSNMSTGFGQFNYHLLKGLFNIKYNNSKIIVHTDTISKFKKEFKNFFGYKYYWGMYRYERFRISKEYDVWHSLNQNTKILPKRNLPYILTIHDVNFMEEKSDEENNLKRNKFFEEQLSMADIIVYISEYSKNQTHKYFDIKDVPEKIIYNGCTIKNKLKNLVNPGNENRPFFFSIGNFLERKNFLSIVKMMKHWQDMDLFIGGNLDTPYGEEVISFVESNDVKNVILLDKISEYQKQCYLEYCEAFLFPSISEGFGLPLLEAMKFEKPILTSTKTCLPEILGDAGYYFTKFDAETMKIDVEKALKDFKADPQDKISIMKNKLEFFTWENAAKQYAELYDQLLNAK